MTLPIGQRESASRKGFEMVVSVPLERRPVTVVVEVGADKPYVIVDAYGDKRDRFATEEEAKAARKEINAS